MPVTLRVGALRGGSAASASGSGGLSGGHLITGLAIGAVVLALYLIGCAIWPYGPCLSCIAHRGRNRGSTVRRWGRCKRCQGSGERIRWGYKLIRRFTAGG
jgi:hypothetical protein